MSDTPITDKKAIDITGGLYGVTHLRRNPKGNFVRVNFARQLERENAALREQIAALGEIACLNLDDATVAKCDAVTGGEKYRDVMHRLFVEQPKKLAALRNEVARLSNRTQWLCTCGGSKASA